MRWHRALAPIAFLVTYGCATTAERPIRPDLARCQEQVAQLEAKLAICESTPKD